MPTTPDYERSTALEYEIDQIIHALFDAYGDEAREAELQAKLSTLSKELALLRLPEPLAA